jgi:hypothetical protein
MILTRFGSSHQRCLQVHPRHRGLMFRSADVIGPRTPPHLMALTSKFRVILPGWAVIQRNLTHLAQQNGPSSRNRSKIQQIDGQIPLPLTNRWKLQGLTHLNRFPSAVTGRLVAPSPSPPPPSHRLGWVRRSLASRKGSGRIGPVSKHRPNSPFEWIWHSGRTRPCSSI